MTPETRRIVLIAVGFLLISGATIGAIGTCIGNAGMLVVDVREQGGDDIRIKIPAALVHAAIGVLPDRLVRTARAEMGETFDRVGPAVRAVCRKMEGLPDFVLVEVVNREEQVSIRKEGGRIVVDVDSDGERVHVVVPLETVRSILGKLGRAA